MWNRGAVTLPPHICCTHAAAPTSRSLACCSPHPPPPPAAAAAARANSPDQRPTPNPALDAAAAAAICRASCKCAGIQMQAATPPPPLILLDHKKRLITEIARLAHPHPHTRLNGLVAPSRSLVTPLPHPHSSLFSSPSYFPQLLSRSRRPRRLPHARRSYLRYANTCAHAVRQALKEPARAKVMRVPGPRFQRVVALAMTAARKSSRIFSFHFYYAITNHPPPTPPPSSYLQAAQRGESFLKVFLPPPFLFVARRHHPSPP